MSRKSPGLAAVLSLLLGPLGGFYVSRGFGAFWLAVQVAVALLVGPGYWGWLFVIQAVAAVGGSVGYNNNHKGVVA